MGSCVLHLIVVLGEGISAMVASGFYKLPRMWCMVWGSFAAWSLGCALSVLHAADPTIRNEAVSSAGPVVVGRVSYRGPVPTPIEVPVDRDSEVCGQVVTVATVSVDAATHGVRDAIVHIDSGQGMMDNGLTQVSVVQNKRCVFYPRVAALRVGVETEIRNDDPVMHNTNMSLHNGTVLNVALVPGGGPVKKTLKRQGAHVVKCNVHKFMQAYRHVFSDPFFDQTNETGQFRIQGLSAGLHTVSVWHETLGELHKEVQVPPRGILNVDFEFK